MTREEAINKLVNARYADEFQGDEELTTAHLMAIQALEQEPCEDVVSREAVEKISRFDPLEPYNSDYVRGFIYGHDRLLNEIRKLPPVRPQEPKWILVSERMPEDGIPCICTVYNTDIYRDNIQVYDNYLVYDEYTEQWIDDDMELCPYDVIAWMPRPEPYKAESEE